VSIPAHNKMEDRAFKELGIELSLRIGSRVVGRSE
jgi:hypothetical protein